MKLKVCGMKFSANIKGVAQLNPEFMGFIQYPASSRFVDLESIKADLCSVDSHIQKVGVFVNETIDEVVAICQRYHLDYAQLHGDETPEYLNELKKQGVELIKAFSISPCFDWQVLDSYETVANYFLFDTASPKRGGSGKKFDWQLLKKYKGNRPFFLSGGIGLEDIPLIRRLQLPLLEGIDVNSRLELKPGFKDLEQVKKLLNELKHGKQIRD